MGTKVHDVSNNLGIGILVGIYGGEGGIRTRVGRDAPNRFRVGAGMTASVPLRILTVHVPENHVTTVRFHSAPHPTARACLATLPGRNALPGATPAAPFHPRPACTLLNISPGMPASVCAPCALDLQLVTPTRDNRGEKSGLIP